MTVDEMAKILFEEIMVDSGGHSLSNSNGDIIISTRNPVNLTQACLIFNKIGILQDSRRKIKRKELLERVKERSNTYASRLEYRNRIMMEAIDFYADRNSFPIGIGELYEPHSYTEDGKIKAVQEIGTVARRVKAQIKGE